MSRLRLLAASLVAIAIPAMAMSSAEAGNHRKPLRVIVEKRSFLDAGKVVPVGAYNRHFVAAHGSGYSPINNLGSFYGRETLPGPFSGENPFANSFYGPTLR